LIFNATPEVLKTLADNLVAIQAFTRAGGSLILCGVTPEGLADYNKIVGVDHVMRPFARERIVLPTPRSRLASGLTAADVVMFSSEKIFPWAQGNYVASDIFSHVVDYDEIATFGASASFGAYGNIVNGFVGADGWKLIQNFRVHEDGSPYAIPITFPKEFEFTEFTWIGNINYWPQTRVNLVFNNDRGNLLSLATEPNDEPQTFALDPPRKASEITLEIAEWMPREGVRATIGIDNIYLKIKRPENFYNTVKPLVNIGGLIEYEMGAGRVVLCNLLFQETEAVPENAGKKRRILSTVLHNLKADALFFLHAARVDHRLQQWQKDQGLWPEIAQYVVRYADGETVEIPILSEFNIHHYAQAVPAVVPGAQIAWMKKYEANDDTATAYMLQWNNPRPEVPIATIDFIGGKDKGIATPVLLALTAAQAE